MQFDSLEASGEDRYQIGRIGQTTLVMALGKGMLDPTCKEFEVALGTMSRWASRAESDWILEEFQKEASKTGDSMDELLMACMDDIPKAKSKTTSSKNNENNLNLEQDLERKDKAIRKGNKANKTTRAEPTSTHKDDSWRKRVEGKWCKFVVAHQNA